MKIIIYNENIKRYYVEFVPTRVSNLYVQVACQNLYVQTCMFTVLSYISSKMNCRIFRSLNSRKIAITLSLIILDWTSTYVETLMN